MKSSAKAITFLAALVLICGTVTMANAALKTRSATLDPATGYPTWYQDNNNLALTNCLDQNGFCLLPRAFTFPAAKADINAANFPDESFYYMADTTVVDPNGTVNLFLYEAALEAGFALNVVDGGQAVFTRIRIRADVTTAGTYTITHPYGVDTFVVAAGDIGPAPEINFSEDVPGLVAGLFDLALASRVGPFLVNSNPATPFVTDPGTGNRYIGNPGTPVTVTGGLNGINSVTIAGPTGTFTSDTFNLMGKIIGLDVAPKTTLNFGAATIDAPPTATAPQTQTVTVTNTTGNSITFGQLVPAGANLADFAIAALDDTCSNKDVAIGGSCSFNITFNPAAIPAVAPRAATILLAPTVTLPAPGATDPPAVTLSLSGTAQFSLTATATGTGPLDNPGSGSVSSTPAGISNCTPTGGTCTASFNVGSTVTLAPTAAATPLSLFDGWSGACTNASGNCLITMDAAKTTLATFIKAWNVTTTPTNATATASGTITDSTVVKHAAGQTVTLTPASACNRVTAFTDNGTSATASLTPVTGLTTSYALANVVADHTLAVTFDNRQAVTVTAGANGTVTGGGISGGSATLICGQQNAAFTVTPNAKFQVRGIDIDSVNQTFTPASSVVGAVSFPAPAITSSSDTPLALTATFMPSGDLNGNSTLGVEDALKALKISLGLQDPVGDDAQAMDVAPLVNGKPGGDTTLDMGDVLTILKRVVNVITW